MNPESGEDNVTTLAFSAFDLLIAPSDVFVSKPSPEAPFMGHTLVFYDSGAVLTVLEWENWSLMEEAVLAGQGLTLLEEEADSAPLLGNFLPGLNLAALRSEEEQGTRHSTLARFQNTTALFSLLLSKDKGELEHLVSAVRTSMQVVVREKDQEPE